MDKVVSVACENFGTTACYVWLQFADAVVEFGAPCPRCGSMTLTRSHPGFASCPSCSARLVLHVAEDATGEVFGEDAQVSADDDGVAPAGRSAAAGRRTVARGEWGELGSPSRATERRAPATAGPLRPAHAQHRAP